VLLPNDPNSYYRERELVPNDMLGDIERAKIVITNYHAFRRRERMEVSKTGRALLPILDAYWVPGVNNLGTFGRWAFAEFKESVYAIAANFDALIERGVGSGAA
jgi:hypothetical protein